MGIRSARKLDGVSSGPQVTVSCKDKCEVLGQKFTQEDVSRSIRIYVGPLLKQIKGDALAVDNKDALPNGAYVHQFTSKVGEQISGDNGDPESHHIHPSVVVTPTNRDLRHVKRRQ